MVHDMVYDIANDSERKIYEEHLRWTSRSRSELARFRVNAFNQNRGRGRRVPDDSSKILSLEQLNAPKGVCRAGAEARGMVLVTGPTGSGKSTTLAGMVNHLNENEYGHI